MNGVSRRSWAGNQSAKQTIQHIMQNNSKVCVTLPNEVEDTILQNL